MSDTETPTMQPETTSGHLPPWKIILHNDNYNKAIDIVQAVVKIIHFEMSVAIQKTEEAHKNGQVVLMVCHREKAELIQEQFASCKPSINVTIEPERAER